ncbi:MAG TPA: prolyl oligopeptidase family serine peptidase [Chitinophagaceae bacterium]|nr:prolyl oligopeptidase family serine peptidase [Chitinophagaceae bacterium]
MKKIIFPALLVFTGLFSSAQKKPLDHTVYDGWQSIGERLISNNGKYIAYTVNPQEGDGVLVIETGDGSYKKEIPRGYNATITEDNLYLVCRIKPLFKDTRDAKIKKKKADDMPKDSLAVVLLGTDSIIKRGGVKSYKIPEKAAGWLAYLYDKGYSGEAKPKAMPDSLTQLNNLALLADSLARVADSLKNKVEEAKTAGISVLQAAKATAKKPSPEHVDEGTILVLRNLQTGIEIKYPLVNEYVFSKNGANLAMETTKKNGDSLLKPLVLMLHLPSLATDTVMKGFNDAKNYVFDEDGSQLAFIAERDSSTKALQKFYKLWYYKTGMDSAALRVGIHTGGVADGLTVSTHYIPRFSKSGARVLFGLEPILPAKDTTIPDFEKAGLDVWNYKDDDLQTVQLKRLERGIWKTCLAVLNTGRENILQLGSNVFANVLVPKEEDAAMFYATTDTGRRVAWQWQGYTLSDVYAINPATGDKKLITRNFKGTADPSYTGKYLLLYDDRQKGYSVYNSATDKLYKIAAGIKYPLYDEDNDVPDDPAPYGIIRWMEDDKYVLIYDRYDVWKVDPENREKPVLLTDGRKDKTQYRYVTLDPEEKFIKPGQRLVFKTYNEKTKYTGLYARENNKPLVLVNSRPALLSSFVKAKDAWDILFSKETFSASPDIFLYDEQADAKVDTDGLETLTPLSHLNPQQSQYLWGTAELFTWKAYTGKQTEGILYKPENFDPAKKYPMIVYFYERNNNTLYNYQAPAPTPSRLNIPFFVSRGYVVFVPDIWYTNGHPGKSACDYVISGTRALIKQGFIDSTKIGLQGQSWGGYQTAYIITQTNLYAAAWAGAPVVNMFSAYGGIRWESGLNRQFQYEKTQSRIGADIWQRPDLYTENSPLFYLPKVKTPVVIMSNDADGAVPWYQGIEFFTAMRRLNKPVWMLTYNGEAHNLVERRNRKDIQIREQQFFDWMLKGEKPPVWITDGVPATLKGIDEGLEIK